MNLFQLLTLPLAGFFFIRSIYKLFRGVRSRNIFILGPLVWLSAGIAIFRPELTHRIATLLGIGRGADLVLYIFVFLFIVTVFYIYNRFQKQDSEITEIVRQLAIRDALKMRPENDSDLNMKETQGKSGFVTQDLERQQ